jgi:hypothetical protein
MVASARVDSRVACSQATCIVRQLFGIAEAGAADMLSTTGTKATALATPILCRNFIWSTSSCFSTALVALDGLARDRSGSPSFRTMVGRR